MKDSLRMLHLASYVAIWAVARAGLLTTQVTEKLSAKQQETVAGITKLKTASALYHELPPLCLCSLVGLGMWQPIRSIKTFRLNPPRTCCPCSSLPTSCAPA